MIKTSDTIATKTNSLHSDTESDDKDAFIKKPQQQRLQAAGNWFTYVKGYSIFLPYLILKEDRKVQAVSACITTNELVANELPYAALGVWLALRLLDGESGIEMIQGLVKIPIAHDRDSAEVMKAIEHGGSLNDLLEAALLSIAPTILDLLIAYVYLWQRFDIYTCLVMVVASVSYVATDIMASNWNIENRRRPTWAETQEAKVMHQAVQGWETVDYFNTIDYETRRFKAAVNNQLAAGRDWKEARRLPHGTDGSLHTNDFLRPERDNAL